MTTGTVPALARDCPRFETTPAGGACQPLRPQQRMTKAMMTTAITPAQIQQVMDMEGLLSLGFRSMRGERRRGAVRADVGFVSDGDAVRSDAKRQGRVHPGRLLPALRLAATGLAAAGPVGRGLVAAPVVAEEAAAGGAGGEQAADEGDLGHSNEFVHVFAFRVGPETVPGDAQ